MDYTDYLYSCSLRDLKREAHEFTLSENKDRTIGILILKLIANKLPKSTSTQTFNFNPQKYELDTDRNLKGRYLYI